MDVPWEAGEQHPYFWDTNSYEEMSKQSSGGKRCYCNDCFNEFYLDALDVLPLVKCPNCGSSNVSGTYF